MSQEYYWIFSLLVSGAALLVSLISIIYVIHRSKKTEAIIAVSRLQDLTSQLIIVVSQQILLFQEYPELKTSHIKEHIRLRGFLSYLRQGIADTNETRKRLLSMKPTDLESWQAMITAFTGWANNVESDIKKETEALETLQNINSKDG